MYHYNESGLPNVFLRSGYKTILINGEEAVSIENLEGLHTAIAQDIVRNSARLTGNEIRFLRKELNLTQNQFSKIIGVSDDTLRGWENARTEVGEPEDKLIRTFYIETVDGDGGLLQIIKDIARLSRKIAEEERQMNFEESDDGMWKIAA